MALVANGLSDRDLAAELEHVDAGQLVLVIDACRSGQALHADDQRQGPMNSQGLAQLAYEKGMYILTAAQAYQDAIEMSDGARAHGLLTEALLEGLHADGASGAGLSLRTWLDGAAAAVPTLYRQAKGEHNLAYSEVDVQKPRVFYRRDMEPVPFIVAKPGQ